MIDRPSARGAYVRAEVATALAHQIRALRMQRGWTQRDLALRLKTSTSVVSRFEDPSYGKLSLQTLLDLSVVFDIGLSVKFVSLVDMVRQTFLPNASERYVEPFQQECAGLGFVADIPVSEAVVRIGVAGSPDSAHACGLLAVQPGLIRAGALPTTLPDSITIKL